MFGWAWPLFGIAAAVSTIGVTTLFRVDRAAANRGAEPARHGGRRRGAGAALSLATLIVSAVCVGGTFMVMTMAGVQEARRLSPGAPTRLIAAMTAAFALGQLAGPVVVSLSFAAGDGFTLPSAVAAALLVGSALRFC